VTAQDPNGVSTTIGSFSLNPGSAYVPDPVMIPIDMARDPNTWAVLYDPECGFCRWSLAGLLALDRSGRLRPVALGTPEAGSLLMELTPEQRGASWHLVAPDGRRWSAGAAAPPLLRLLPGGRAPGALLASMPRATERVYRWVADHRSTLSRLIPVSAKRRADARIAAHDASSEGSFAAK
jgi:predicted DCC family thiol-disulfide oxidoreductase YuxK